MGGAWVVPICLCARGGWCLMYHSSSLLYPFSPMASGALLACSCSSGSSNGGGFWRTCLPYLVLLVLAHGCPCAPRAWCVCIVWWWCVAPSVLLYTCVLHTIRCLFKSLHFILLLPRRLLLRVFSRLRYISCFACGGMHVRVRAWLLLLLYAACGAGHVLSATPLGYLRWRGYRCAFLVCVAGYVTYLYLCLGGRC